MSLERVGEYISVRVPGIEGALELRLRSPATSFSSCRATSSAAAILPLRHGNHPFLLITNLLLGDLIPYS